jgi:hypothetical protein
MIHRFLKSSFLWLAVVAVGLSLAAYPASAAGVAARPILLAQAKSPTLMDILPAGKGLPLLLENCGSCHSTVCAVKGQRTKGRWSSLRRDHQERVAGMSEEEFATLFSYLSENFSDSKPEPNLTPELAAMATCTPF